eukprot:8691400-Pyramimonas_sp.AAC.1
MAHEAPRRPQRQPKRTLTWPKKRPRRPKRAPRRPQEGPKRETTNCEFQRSAQRSSLEDPRLPQAAQEAPMSHEAPKRPQGAPKRPKTSPKRVPKTSLETASKRPARILAMRSQRTSQSAPHTSLNLTHDLSAVS